jgi:hypothetical protein
MAGDDVPDRAAGRQRPRAVRTAPSRWSRAGDGSQRRPHGRHRQQDLHLRRRPGHDRQHRAPGAGRLPDAPAGTKGLSLFLVPKFLPDGRRNAPGCDGIEHKMGIHGSATCQMRFEGAEGWLLGEPHRGLAAMFLMMNAARLHVACRAWAPGAAHRRTRSPTRERLQLRAAEAPGEAPKGSRRPDRAGTRRCAAPADACRR